MTSLKKLIAGSLLAAAAAVAPAHAFDFASGGTGNSSLVLTVFDQVAGTSLMVDLGLNYLDFSNNATSKDGSAATDVTPDSGYSLSFNIDLSIFGENNSNMEYTIFAADAQGTFANTETLVSADPTLGTFSGTNGDILNISNVAYTTGVAGQCNNALMTTVCTATNFGATGVYVGGTNWGDNFQYLDVNGSASVGTTLGMYGLNRTSNTSTAAATVYQFKNSEGVAGLWLLSSNGTLTWTSAAVSAVPVPAAVWLLLSGLGGLGVIGRRRKAA